MHVQATDSPPALAVKTTSTLENASPPAHTHIDTLGPPASTVAVRVLCDFAARCGDLDLRFSPSPSGAEGVAGHNTVTQRRGAQDQHNYQREVALSAQWQGLRVQGRADGWDAQAQRLEEIKTHRGDANATAANQRALHWAQAQVYGHMLCAQLHLPGLHIALVYFNIDTEVETPITQWHGAADLATHFVALCQRYSGWAAQETVHRQARDAALHALAFPFPAFRAGQRELAQAVFRAHRAGRVLLAQAPTGIGKTAATVFAALKAMPAQAVDKLFYLTPRTTGRHMALQALQRLVQPEPAGTGATALPLRVLERVAKEKACEHPANACHGDSCPLARGFYDRLPAARQAAAEHAWLDQTQLRNVALAHSVCPYFLGQEMQRWSDVAVGDVNHFFDLGAHWHALTVAHGWKVSLLIDEAHGLIDRARAMYSASLLPAAFQTARTTAPLALKKPLDGLHRRWNALEKTAGGEQHELPEPPTEFMAAVQQACNAVGDHYAEHPQDATDGPLQRWYFEALHFQRAAELFDAAHSLCELTPGDAANPRQRASNRCIQPQLHLRCLVPGLLLQPRWSDAHSITLFSATLSPMEHPAQLLALPADTLRIEVPSPFAPDQLSVHVARHISTRWADRAASLAPMADVMAQQFTLQPGNYLAFFSSFDYLQQAMECLQQRQPQLPVWAQARGMNEPERDAFLARFVEGGQGIGFAVLGGAFGEGIDLPGQRLIGAFIATLGMPPTSSVHERLRERLQASFGRGHDHAYLFPGLQKVVQAAGRVIRTETDRGTVWLMDDRFNRPEVRRCLPAWWPIVSSAGSASAPAAPPPATT